MSYADAILPEFEQEMSTTRQVIAAIPDELLDWKAQPKFHTIGWNANHLAETPGWVKGTLEQSRWDIDPVDGDPYESPKLTSVQEILDLFDRNVAEATEAFKSVREESLGDMWSLLKAGEPIFSMPRAAVIRIFVLNHLIHHRAHLCVYLRMNDIELPGMYGPGGNAE